MELLKNIPIGIDTRNDGVQFNLNLFSKGNKADYRDDFPITIVRTTGARIEIINNAFKTLQISNIYLGIVINKELTEVWASSHFNKTTSQEHLINGQNFEIAFEGKKLINIFDNHREENGVIIISSSLYLIRSNCFDGDYIEYQLEKLNRNTNPEYQNWCIDGFHELDIVLKNEHIPEELKSLKF